MVDHLKFPAQVRVFVLKGVIVVRTCRQNLFHAIHIHGLDRHQCLHLKQHFIPCPAGNISTVNLFGAKYSIIHLQVIQNLNQFFGYLLIPVVECPGRAYP